MSTHEPSARSEVVPALIVLGFFAGAEGLYVGSRTQAWIGVALMFIGLLMRFSARRRATMNSHRSHPP